MVAACHNAEDSVTVSGLIADVEKVVEQLKSEGIFAKRVNSSGVAFHSPFMSAAHAKMLAEFQRIIPEPLERTERWISTSIIVSAN